MLQIVVAIGSAFALIVRAIQGKPKWWLLFSIGLILAIISWAGFKINKGIRANGQALREVGNKIGDINIPDISKKWSASSYWFSILLAILSSAFFILGIVTLFCNI